MQAREEKEESSNSEASSFADGLLVRDVFRPDWKFYSEKIKDKLNSSSMSHAAASSAAAFEGINASECSESDCESSSENSLVEAQVTRHKMDKSVQTEPVQFASQTRMIAC